MRSFTKIALVSLPLLFATPTFAQVSWGVDLRFGTPPPHQVIVERPYPDAVWQPGYYENGPEYQHVWIPGRWHPHYWVPQGRQWVRNSDRGEYERRSYHQDEYRGGGRYNRNSNHYDEGRGRGDAH